MPVHDAGMPVRVHTTEHATPGARPRGEVGVKVDLAPVVHWFDVNLGGYWVAGCPMIQYS